MWERAFDECGPWMYVLLAVGIVLLSVVMERFITLFFRWRIRLPLLLDQIDKLVRAGNLERGLKLARAVSQAMPVGRVVQAGLERATEGPESAAAAMEGAVAEARPQLRRRLPALPVLAAASLAVGLVGSYQLGGFEPPAGLDTPLPFGQPMAMFPALTGGLAAAIAVVAFAVLLLRALGLSRELDVARERVLRLVVEQYARSRDGSPQPERGGDGPLPRLGNLGLPTGHVQS